MLNINCIYNKAGEKYASENLRGEGSKQLNRAIDGDHQVEFIERRSLNLEEGTK